MLRSLYTLVKKPTSRSWSYWNLAIMPLVASISSKAPRICSSIWSTSGVGQECQKSFCEKVDLSGVLQPCLLPRMHATLWIKRSVNVACLHHNARGWKPLSSANLQIYKPLQLCKADIAHNSRCLQPPIPSPGSILTIFPNTEEIKAKLQSQLLQIDSLLSETHKSREDARLNILQLSEIPEASARLQTYQENRARLDTLYESALMG